MRKTTRLARSRLLPALLACGLLLAGPSAHAQWPGFHYSSLSDVPPYNGVTYGRGGILSGKIDVYLIFYGGWGINYVDPHDPTAKSWSAALDQTIIQKYFSHLGSSGWFKIATTYYDEQGHRPTGLNLAGAWTVPISPQYTLNGTFTVNGVPAGQKPQPALKPGTYAWTPPGYAGNLLGYDSGTYNGTMQQLIHDQIVANASSIAHPSQSVFIVLPAPDVALWDIDGTGQPTNVSSCGFHNAMSSDHWSDLTQYGFSRAPVFGTGDSITTGCAVGDFQPYKYPNSPQADLLINETSHELLEAISDPYPNSGWNPEIGDACGPGGSGLRPGQTAWGPYYAVTNPYTSATGYATIHVGSNDYVVQRMWVNSHGGLCGFGVPTPGDFNGDGRADLVNVARYASVRIRNLHPTAWLGLSNGDGTFTTVDTGQNYDQFSQQFGAQTISGNFVNDGIAGLASFHGPSWQTVPMLYGQPGNSWTLTNYGTDFNQVVPSGSQLIAFDWNGDGVTELAALNAQTQSLDVILSAYAWPGDWSSTYSFATFFPEYGAAPYILTGDFNGDGRDDITATGTSGGTFIPVAINNGDGSFNVVTFPSTFAQYAGQPGAQVVVGDFNGDGLDDLLTNCGANYGGFLLGLAHGDGSFDLAFWSSDLSYWSTQPNVRLLSGDFDGDGLADLTVVGPGMTFVPVAFSRGAAYFGTSTTTETAFTAHSSSAVRQTLSSWLSGPGR